MFNRAVVDLSVGEAYSNIFKKNGESVCEVRTKCMSCRFTGNIGVVNERKEGNDTEF